MRCSDDHATCFSYIYSNDTGCAFVDVTDTVTIFSITSSENSQECLTYGKFKPCYLSKRFYFFLAFTLSVLLHFLVGCLEFHWFSIAMLDLTD